MSLGQGLSLRAATDADRLFLEQAFADSRADELRATVWSGAEKTAFCQEQFATQDQHYRQPIGHLYVDRRPRAKFMICSVVRPIKLQMLSRF